MGRKVGAALAYEHDGFLRSYSMRSGRSMRLLRVMASGALLLQVGGCSFADFNEFLQTVFLGIAAAGAVAILQNI